MSRAALMLDTDPALSSKGRDASSSLRVSKPGDAFETEAERVAEKVSRGGKIGRTSTITPTAWSFSKVDVSRVQRDTPVQSPIQGTGPKPNNYDEALKKVAEAFLKTDLGKQITDAAQKDPVVKGVEGFVDTLPGKFVAGAAATGVVSALAATHQPLPAQIPAIPLDKIKPGLSVKITYEGPVDRPTAASISFSYTPKAADDKKKKESVTDKRRAETARMAADMYKYQEGLKTPEQRKAEAEDAQRVLDTVLHRRSAAAGGIDVSKYNYPNLAPARPTGPQLTLPQFQSPLKPKTPTLLDKQLELKPLSAPSLQTTTPEGDKKKEEVPVQRKAERAEPLYVDTAEVESVVASPGRPLDPETRRYMESHIGFDFGKVRVHTDARAAASARALGARAYTLGSHVVFSSGRYAPKSAEGRRLLAHELTHVVQQSPSIASRPLGVSRAPSKIQRDDEGPSIWSDPKGWLLSKAKKIPGYDLFCTIIGKDLATWQPKNNSKEAILKEILKLIPGGQEAYDRVVAVAGALEKGWAWVKEQLTQRQLTLEHFQELVQQAIDSVHVSDIKDPGAAIDRVIAIFKPAFDSVLDFARVLFNKLFEVTVEFVMDKFGDLGKKVLGILRKAGNTFMAIIKDPIKFVGNLVEAAKRGFSNFADNFLKHLQDSLMDFLFGEIGSKIKPPKEFSLSAIFNLVLDVLELQYDKFRERLVAKTSEDTVAFLEGTYDFIMKLASAKSLAGAWEIFKQRAGELINQLVDTAIDSIKNWVLTKIVQAAIKKVLELFTPASAIIAAIEAIYNTIKVIIEKGKQLLAMLEAITNSLSLIVEGNLSQAATFVENALARTLTFVLAFLAEQVGLGGIGETIRGIITKVREKVWGVIDKVLDFVIGKTKGLYERGKAAASKALAWWQQRRDVLIGNEEHSVYMDGSEDAPKLMVASTPTSWADYVSKLKVKGAQKKLLDETVKLVAELEQPLNKEKTAGENSEQITRKRTVFKQVSDNIIKLGFGKEAPPVAEIEYDQSLAPGDGGVRATARVLSSLLKAGSQPSDDAPIWKTLGSLVGTKNYVQGHLLNHNLGGPGLRFNLTPINKKANSRHHAIVEKDIKRMVLTEKKVVFYEVKAVYDTHPAKPKSMIQLEQAKEKAALSDADDKKLKEYQAEQKLAVGLDYRAYELQHTAENKWEKVEGTEVSGGIPNQLELEK
jgi:hypothetical protein